jgi:hypothetical protein
MQTTITTAAEAVDEEVEDDRVERHPALGPDV